MSRPLRRRNCWTQVCWSKWRIFGLDCIFRSRKCWGSPFPVGATVWLECFLFCFTFGLCCCHVAARPNNQCTKLRSTKHEQVKYLRQRFDAATLVKVTIHDKFDFFWKRIWKSSLSEFSIKINLVEPAMFFFRHTSTKPVLYNLLPSHSSPAYMGIPDDRTAMSVGCSITESIKP